MLETRTYPFVSIVMPTHNRAELIVETIKSIQNQTYSHWELIIVDDGSDDNTESLVGGLADNKIRYFKEERTGIVGKIKNIGIKKARGELIAFMDSDDLWADTKLEKQIVALHALPEAGFSLTGGYNFQLPGQPLQYFYSKTSGTLYGHLLIPFFKSEVAALMPSLMVRKQCLLQTGLFAETYPFSDIDFLLQLAVHFKAVVLYEPLLFRRIHTKNHSHQNWRNGFAIKKRLVREYRMSGLLPKPVAREALYKLHINLGEACLSHKQYRQAQGNFLSAWRYRRRSIIPWKKILKSMWRALQHV